MHFFLFSFIGAISATVCADNLATRETSEHHCICTEFSQIETAQKECKDIVLRNIHFPSDITLNLTRLHSNTVVRFEGLTTFGFTNSSSFVPIVISGKNITVTSAAGAIIDGNGSAYWDGLGSNGGVPK